MKKIGVLWALLLISGLNVLAAQQYTRIGVVDMVRLYNQFFKESKAVKELEDMKLAVQKDIDKMKEEIRVLNEQRLEVKKTDEKKALEMEADINKKQEYLKDFVKVKQAQLVAKKDSLTKDNAFLPQILESISKVAEEQGCSLVMRMDDPNLLYYNQEVDLTELVIKKLAGK